MDKDALIVFDVLLFPFAFVAFPFTAPLYAIKAALFGQSGDGKDFLKIFAIATTLNDLFGG